MGQDRLQSGQELDAPTCMHFPWPFGQSGETQVSTLGILNLQDSSYTLRRYLGRLGRVQLSSKDIVGIGWV